MKKLQPWLPLLFAFTMIIGMTIGFYLRQNNAGPGIFHSAKRSAVQEVIELIRREYVDPVKVDSINDRAIEAILSHLDPHSVYIPPSHLREVNEDLQGNFEGIGVEFLIISDTVNVISVLKDGPSDEAGLKVGDKFLRVGNINVAGDISSEKIKELLRGSKGSQAEVEILRGLDRKVVTITRGTIPLVSVDAAYMLDQNTGIIHLNKFSTTTYEEFSAALEKLRKAGMKQLIVDVRDNGGGILGEAVDIADEFLDGQRMIVYTERGEKKNEEFRAKRPGQFEKGRLAILVNEGSASASEVLAGALQDWERAVIIGRRTFGKGLVQEQFNLSNGGALRLTVARYFTPTGRSIQKPYSEGREAYNEELLSRFNSGEVVRGDTVTTKRGEEFQTSSGKIVYGGGGITPDVFVPFDTVTFSPHLTSLFRDQVFSKFIYTLYVENRDYFDQFKNPAQFASTFHPDEFAWDRLVKFAGGHSVDISKASDWEKSELLRRIKAWMGRQLWRMEGYYMVHNRYDDVVQRAMQVLSSRE